MNSRFGLYFQLNKWSHYRLAHDVFSLTVYDCKHDDWSHRYTQQMIMCFKGGDKFPYFKRGEKFIYHFASQLFWFCIHTMDKLPAEVYRIIGSRLNQQEQRECTLVCKHWQKVFSPLVFAKAVLITRSQVEGYLCQSAELKKYTISLHLVAPITNEEFKDFVSSCPKLNCWLDLEIVRIVGE